jgi:UDP-N-acetyl-D-glucosamine dehydrogenase
MSELHPLTSQTLKKLQDKGAVVGVVGLGYVGLPLLMCFHQAGLKVVGFDIDASKCEKLARGENYLPHLGSDLCKGLTTQEGAARFTAGTDPKILQGCDAIVLCVPTPLGQHTEPDLSYVEQTGRMVGGVARAGALVALESTSYPGTTREVLLPALLEGAKGRGLVDVDNDCPFLLAFSPEREDPGNPNHTTRTIPKLVGGRSAVSLQAALALYSMAVQTVVPVETMEIAEAAKVFENVFRAVNIALVNELKLILEPMGIDVWQVIAAASTKPFGFMPFFPGPGLGGHCIPIDPFYLAWKARQFKVPARFIELAGEINTAMPSHVVQRTMLALNDQGKAVRGAKILVLGLAYKPDIADVRESPSFEIIERLEDLGAEVLYSDPHVPKTWAMRKHDLGMESVDLRAEVVRGMDAVLISTAHQAFDYGLLAREAKLIIDTRNAMRKAAGVDQALLKGKLILV